MLNVISFRLSGEFASFRDPSVTSNQLVYLIPSKTAVIGIIGAILGVQRGHDFEKSYSSSYLELFRKTQIGIELLSESNKFTFFTNHRSLKEDKTKPYKTEVLVSPSYNVYVRIEDEQTSELLFSALRNNSFAYPPYLGHAYCPAKVSDAAMHEAEFFDGLKYVTSSVILDESETYSNKFRIDDIDAIPEQRHGTSIRQQARLVIERHIHHFFEKDKFEKRVLKHWIPVGASPYRVSLSERPKLSKTVKITNRDTTVCIY